MNESIRFARTDEVAEEYAELLGLLPIGRGNAISKANLCALLGMDEQDLKDWILAARIAGCFIISGQKGYWLPEDAADIRGYVIKRNIVIQTAKKAIKAFEEELTRIGTGGGGAA